MILFLDVFSMSRIQSCQEKVKFMSQSDPVNLFHFCRLWLSTIVYWSCFAVLWPMSVHDPWLNFNDRQALHSLQKSGRAKVTCKSPGLWFVSVGGRVDVHPEVLPQGDFQCRYGWPGAAMFPKFTLPFTLLLRASGGWVSICELLFFTPQLFPPFTVLW